MRGILHRSRRRHRDGFILAGVLWVLVGIAAIALVLRRTVSDGIMAVQRRTQLEQSFWLAEECAARALLVAGTALAADSVASPTSETWRKLNTIVRAAALVEHCSGKVTLSAGGTALDVNRATEAQLKLLLAGYTSSPLALEELVDGIMDWRDPDDMPRAHGAERSWYLNAGRHTPRNGDFTDAHEIEWVRGADEVVRITELLGVDTGPLSLALAPVEVLRVLPGFGPEALRIVEEMRDRGETLESTEMLAARLSPTARDSLMSRQREILAQSQIDPSFWSMRVQGEAGEGAASTSLELRLVRSGLRIAIVSRRIWP